MKRKEEKEPESPSDKLEREKKIQAGAGFFVLLIIAIVWYAFGVITANWWK